MTRVQLHALVWKEPMIHVAKRFGISDVVLRKINASNLVACIGTLDAP
jgi:hypothetical protein